MQEVFNFGPQPGQIWVIFSNIVIVTQVGGYSSNIGYWLPNLVTFIPVGQVKPHGDGAYWREDLNHPGGGQFLDHGMYSDAYKCDKLYCKPWDGCGVFFATAQAQIIVECRRWLKEHKDRRWNDKMVLWYEAKIEKMFAKRIAPKGFQ